MDPHFSSPRTPRPSGRLGILQPAAPPYPCPRLLWGPSSLPTVESCLPLCTLHTCRFLLRTAPRGPIGIPHPTRLPGSPVPQGDQTGDLQEALEGEESR